MHFLRQEPLCGYTTFRIGGPAEALCVASSAGDVRAAAKEARSMGLEWRVIGHGSNILAADQGVDNAIIVFGDNSPPHVEDKNFVTVSGGFPLTELVLWLASKGFGGTQDLAGIPGTVGGAITGNAGAYGVAIGNCVHRVLLLGRDEKTRVVNGSELGFSYRTSQFKSTNEAILEAVIKVEPCDESILKSKIDERLADRQKKHPNYREVPTAGSFFKNPIGPDGKTIAAGRLLEDAGCKGLHVGGASVWPRHANIIVTSGHATAKDVMELAEEMQRRVEKKFGVRLEREVCYLG